jgi:hypothetical protein
MNLNRVGSIARTTRIPHDLPFGRALMPPIRLSAVHDR